MNCVCGGKTSVTATVKPLSGGVLRYRKCAKCTNNFTTMEAVYNNRMRPDDVVLAPKPKAKMIYTNTEAKQVNQHRVDTRRVNEDRREKKVSNYYIEDDGYDSFDHGFPPHKR